jgi:ankyrin repeat protein
VPVRRLPHNPSLEHLRKQAKAVQRGAHAGDAEALALIQEHHPRVNMVAGDTSALPLFALADAQLVVARSYGFSSWPKLRRHLEIVAQYSRSPHHAPSTAAASTDSGATDSGATDSGATDSSRSADSTPASNPLPGPLSAVDLAVLADEFLRLACLTYGGDSPARREQARALLAAHPALRTANVHTMAACGEAEAIRELLTREPALANRLGGPHQWEPLLYLAYGRLDEAKTPAEAPVETTGPVSGSESGAAGRPGSASAATAGGTALETARLLLAAGADPNAGYLWDGLPSPFTALTGAFGEGEDGTNQPPHRDSLELARLLLDAGADPNDSQTLYNRQFRPGTAHLDLLLRYGLGRGDGGVWHVRLGHAHATPAQMVQDQLLWAARANMPERVRLLLAHGGVADGLGTAHPGFQGRTAYELAALNGNTEIMELLGAAGANVSTLDLVEAFLSACLSGEQAEVTRQLAADATLLPRALARDPHAIMRAVEIERPAAVRLLAGLGFDVNALHRTTALHEAAWRGNLELVALLLELGADPMLRDTAFGATPEGWAQHNQQHAVAGYLAEYRVAQVKTNVS